MADSVTIKIDATALTAALERLGPTALRYTLPACRVSADRIVAEARARVARATGETAGAIRAEPSYNGDGYVVISDNHRMPNLPLWIEKGTRRGKPGSHTQAARPYFYPSVALEQGAHERRIKDAIDDALAAEGLGG